MSQMDKQYGDVNENNTLYQTLKDEHPCWLFIGNAILKTLYGVPGILLNLSLLVVTVRSKSLRGSANFLLALNSLFELLHQPGQILCIFMAFSGANFLPMSTAVKILTPSLFGLIAVGPSLFFTGVDRLMAVTFVLRYQRINKALYLLVVSLLCSAFSGYGVFLVHQTAQKPQWNEYQTTGNIGEIFHDESSQFYNNYGAMLNGVTIVLYLLVGLIIGCRSSAAAVDHSHRCIFRSLVTIIAFGLGGYFLMRIFTAAVMPNVGWSKTTVWTVHQAFVLPLNLSAGSNAPILYLTSTEYRKAYRREMRFFLATLRRLHLLKAAENNIANNNNNKVQVLAVHHAMATAAKRSASSMVVHKAVENVF